VKFNCTYDTININWDPPLERNGIITNYTIDLYYHENLCSRDGGLMHNISVVSMEPLTYYAINGLSAYWDYNFTITATNYIGSGNATDNFVFKTKLSGKC